jgi:hypothetical protein
MRVMVLIEGGAAAEDVAPGCEAERGRGERAARLVTR